MLHPRPRFQSTPPRRGDETRSRARVRGPRFQSTPPRRGDVRSLEADDRKAPFQSTPPRRGDRQTNVVSPRKSSFNPRPREGATLWGGELNPRYVVSIHAPAKGRLYSPVASNPCFSFQSTPPRRGDSAIPTGCWGSGCKAFSANRGVQASCFTTQSPDSVRVGCGKGVYGDREPPSLSV